MVDHEKAPMLHPPDDGHIHLTRTIGELEHWITETSDFGVPNFGELGTRLKTLRTVLVEHFRHEEEDGYLHEPLAIAPRFSRDAEELLVQHGEFLDRLNGLIRRLRDYEVPFETWQQAAAVFQAFLADLHQHETREIEIFQAAFEDDIGAGD